VQSDDFPPNSSSVAGIALASLASLTEEAGMLWILAVLLGGLGFGYVVVRRKRKADAK
jgi:hypothetical protein